MSDNELAGGSPVLGSAKNISVYVHVQWICSHPQHQSPGCKGLYQIVWLMAVSNQSRIFKRTAKCRYKCAYILYSKKCLKGKKYIIYFLQFLSFLGFV